MRTFDVHQHLLPAPLVDALRARRQPPQIEGRSLELHEGSFPFREGDNDLGERIALLDRDGTDVAVISLAPTLEVERHQALRDAYHDGIREVVAAAGGRLRALASGTCLEGFAGACVSAQALVGGLEDLPSELARAGQVLFVHPGPAGAPPPSAPPWWAAVVDYSAQMQAAYLSWLAHGVDRHPDLEVVFAVLAGGAPIQLERLRSRGGAVPDAAAHTHLDTASYGPRALRLCAEAIGADRLVFGSDAPVLPAAPSLQALAELGDAALSVRCENPSRLFR